ncbi:MAG TPA: hybrid sensor histidine kinase/response regulator [Candidatus Eremiobacteraeota bacterium]|nr:hybrid sensor histidine kinase/response regulator [Candidatus Eremiobacteraeota bacterium]
MDRDKIKVKFMNNLEATKPLLLIADDMPVITNMLSYILKRKNYAIAIATNGIETIEMAKKHSPDLILLDIIMPDLDGFTVCKRLKESPETKEIPIIFLTAKDDPGEIQKGFESGAVDYVKKPFNHTELMARVKTHLELKSARDSQKELLNKVTEQAKKLEENLEEIFKKNKELKKLSNLKNEFLGMVAHDLRTPIAIIQIASEHLLTQSSDIPFSQEQIEILKEINLSSEHMFSLLDDLLDITAIESGNLNLKITKQNYIEFLKHNIKLNNPLAHKKRITLKLTCEDNIPEVRFDKNKISQVMNNLITNAIKFSESDTKITISVKKKKDYVVTGVIDEGQGIAEKYLTEIFKAFPKTNIKATAGEKSTGLGLAITKKIVEGHGGQVRVESKVGKGSKFYFTLPLKEE